MGRTIETGGVITNIWRSVTDDGEAIETDEAGLYKLVEPDPQDNVKPPKGTRAKLRISGFSEVFQLPGFNDASVMEDKVKLEWLILGISGNNLGYMKGKRFAQIFTYKVSANSNLGKLFATLTGAPVPANDPNYPFDGFIDTECTTLIGESNNGNFALVFPEAIETAKTVLSPAVAAYFSGNGAAPVKEKELAGVAAGGGDEEFVGDDDL